MVVFPMRLQRKNCTPPSPWACSPLSSFRCCPKGPLTPGAFCPPCQVWWMVVLISAIGFANYILLKFYGAKGIAYTGFLGGLVNSTATGGASSLRASSGTHPKASSPRHFPGPDAGQGGRVPAQRDHLRALCPVGPSGSCPAGRAHAGLRLSCWLLKETGKESAALKRRWRSSWSRRFPLRSALTFGLFFAVITVIGGHRPASGGRLRFLRRQLRGAVSSRTPRRPPRRRTWSPKD